MTYYEKISDTSKFNVFKKCINAVALFIKDLINENNRVLIVSHYDADGLTSAAIFLDILLQKGVVFHLKIIEQIDENFLFFLNKSVYPYVILLDLGSGSLKLLSRCKDKKMLILDHHILSIHKERIGNIHVLNPHLFGIDGSVEISTSGITYFLAREIVGGKSDKYIAPAIIGALGDRQDIGPRFRLVGLNDIIVREGIEKKIIKTSIGLRLYGLTRYPLVKALEYTVDPFIPGLSGDEGACLLFFKKIGIDPVENNKLRHFFSLSQEEVKKLATELIKYAISKGISVKDAERLFGTNYYIIPERENTMLYDARDYSIVINACGRLERYDLAILLLNNYISREEITKKVMEIIREYRRKIAQFFEIIHSNDYTKLVEKSKYFMIIMSKGISSKMSGALASMLSTSFTEKPFIAVVAPTIDENFMKISVRKTHTKVFEKNINLGKILEKVSEAVRGWGGGHSNAGGAIIPRRNIKNFIKHLEEEIEKQ